MSGVFDLTGMTFSLIVLRPKKAFFEWLEPVVLKRGLSLDDVFFPEESGVWLIPSIGSFDDTPSFEGYLQRLKPVIVLDELGKFGPDTSEMPSRIDVSICDALFEFEVRDRAQIARLM